VRVTKCAPAEAGFTEPQFPALPPPPHIPPAPAISAFGESFRRWREARG